MRESRSSCGRAAGGNARSSFVQRTAVSAADHRSRSARVGRRDVPTGEPSTVEERLADILRRYPSDSVVHRAISVAFPMLREPAREIESRLARLAVSA